MGKWAVGLLLLVALVQVQEGLCSSAGQAAALAPNAATDAERALPGFQGELTEDGGTEENAIQEKESDHDFLDALNEFMDTSNIKVYSQAPGALKTQWRVFRKIRRAVKRVGRRVWRGIRRAGRKIGRFVRKTWRCIKREGKKVWSGVKRVWRRGRRYWRRGRRYWRRARRFRRGHVKAQIAFGALAGRFALRYVGRKALGCVKSSIG